MPVCTRNGCKKDLSAEDIADGTCQYHPGGPVFHEGLKSWSCCSDVNKPELEFDAFVKIPGCHTGSHTTELPKVVKPQSSGTLNLSMSGQVDGKEVYNSTSAAPAFESLTLETKPRTPPPPPAPIVEEEDDLDLPVNPGTTCRRKGCGKEFVNNEESRIGNGEGAICTYHPADPIFHEGSKGYRCCKRRVLEFDEFLKIKGCKTGRHVFIPKKSDDKVEVLTDCRIDHYQTPSEVHVSIFAKKADKTRSTVNFENNAVKLDLYLPDSKRFHRSLNLYGPIDPQASKFTFFGTKVELILKKKDHRSWNLLEHSAQDLGSYNLTFGVGGRTGTIGGKQPVLDETNRLKG